MTVLSAFTPIDQQDPRGAMRVVRANLTAPTGNVQIAAIQNPFNEDAVVVLSLLDVKTAAGGVCTADVGVAADATTSDDTLIDGKDINATGLSSNILEFVAGTGNAAGHVPIGATEYVTVTASAAGASLVGVLSCAFVKVAALAT